MNRAATAPGTGTFDPAAFLEQRSSVATYRVDEVALTALPGWSLGDRLTHATGRFFSVEGVAVRTSYGPEPAWTQPIIVQPEIGILGILTAKVDGVRRFLMQAKMEPGNSEFVQFAPTVQATPSNYQQVHGGRATPYLEYFREHTGRRVLFDQLLSEHASWYLHKRNRNMVVEVPTTDDVEVGDDFAWLTARQLRELLARGDSVNMNARTVLSGLSHAHDDLEDVGDQGAPPDPFHELVVESHRYEHPDDVEAALTWIIDQKSTYDLDVRRIPLGELDGWVHDDAGIRHVDGGRFRIVGASVVATSREVTSWSQPMLAPYDGHVVGLVCQRRAGVLHVLVQAMVQPGLVDRLELAPTVHLTPGPHRDAAFPPLVEYLDAPISWIRVRADQSEDGGRFLHADTTHVVVEVPEDHHVEVPDRFRWMTLGVLHRLIRAGYYVNVETRSLLACLL